jgi:hypothetical protein
VPAVSLFIQLLHFHNLCRCLLVIGQVPAVSLFIQLLHFHYLCLCLIVIGQVPAVSLFIQLLHFHNLCLCLLIIGQVPAVYLFIQLRNFHNLCLCSSGGGACMGKNGAPMPKCNLLNYRALLWAERRLLQGVPVHILRHYVIERC